MANKKLLGADGKWRDAKTGRFTTPPRKPRANATASPARKPSKAAAKPPRRPASPAATTVGLGAGGSVRGKPRAKPPSRSQAAFSAPPPGAVSLDSRGRWRDKRGRLLSVTPAPAPTPAGREGPVEAARRIRDRASKGEKIPRFSYAGLPREVMNASGKGIDPDFLFVFQVSGAARRRMRLDKFRKFMTQEKYKGRLVEVAETNREMDKDERDLWCVAVADPKTGDILRIVWEFDPRHFVEEVS